MSENDNIIVDMSTRIFQDLCDPQTINSAQNDAWKEPLWSALEEAGLTAGFVSEELGGAGIEISDAFEILRVAGKFAVPTPLAETMLAGWLLSQGEIGFPGGRSLRRPSEKKDRLSIDNNNTLTGTARSVPFAREADSLQVARRGDEVVIALVDAASCQIANGLSLADDAKDEVTLDGVVASEVGRAPDEFNEDALFMMGALRGRARWRARLKPCWRFPLPIRKTGSRSSGRSRNFKRYNTTLRDLPGKLPRRSAQRVRRRMHCNVQVRLTRMYFEIASAKIRVGEAAGEGAGIAHQVHGAIGFTMEHILHRYSRRVWSWRDEFGSESIWAVRLGEAVAAKGSDALWATLASR